MAANQLFLILSVALVVLPSVALATTYVVGDETGWTIGFDYQAWAQGKEFHVGDSIVFHYPIGVHNVFKVNGTSFQDCSVPPPSEALTSGSDIITLATPGKKWYICGVGQHCSMGGQRLFITVQAQAMAPYMPPTIAPSGYAEVMTPGMPQIPSEYYVDLTPAISPAIAPSEYYSTDAPAPSPASAGC